MGSQITKITSICGDQYPGIGYQVDCGKSVRVAMAWLLLLLGAGAASPWRYRKSSVSKLS